MKNSSVNKKYKEKLQRFNKFKILRNLILADELMSLGQQTKSLKRELETANRKNFELDRIINESEMANQIAYQKIQLLLIELQKYRQLRGSYSNKNTTQHFDELAVLGRQVQSLVNPNSEYSSSNKVNRQMRVSLEIQLLKKERQQVQKMLKQREGSPFERFKVQKRGLDQMQSELINDFQRFHNVQIDQTLRDEQSRIKYKQRQQQKQLIGKLKIMRSIEISSSEFQPPSHFDMDQISPRLENTQSVDNFGQQKCQSLLQQNQQLIREQKCLKSRLMFLQSKAQELQNSDQQQQILLVKYKDQLRNLKRQSECKYQSLLKQVAELSSENQELKKRKQQEHKIEFTSKRQKQSQNLHQKQLAIIQKQQKSLILLQNQQTFKEKQLFKRQNYIAKQKIKELNNLLFLKQQRYQTLNQQYLSTKQETDVLKHEIEKLQIQVQQMKRLIDGLNREKDKIMEEFYQKQRKKTYQGKQQSHSQLIMLQQQNRALRNEIQEQADTKFKQLKAMQNDKIQMAKKIRWQNLKIDQLQSKEKQYQIQISELRRQRSDDKENQRRISREFEILMHEKGQIQRDVKRIQDSLGKANQKLSIQNSQLQKQLQNIYQNERQINKLIGLLKAKERDIQQSCNQKTRLQKQQKLIKAQNLRLKQQIEILISSQGKLNRKVQSINLQLAQALNLNRAQFEQINKRQMQIRHSKSQIVKLEIKVSQTVDQLSSICRQKEQLKHQLSLKQAQAQRIKQLQKLYEKQFQLLKSTNQQLKIKIIENSSPISQNKLQLGKKYAQLDYKRKQMQIQKIKTIELEQQLKNKETQLQKLRRLIQQHKKSASLQIGSLKGVIQDQNNVIKALDLGSKIYQRPPTIANQVTILEHRNQIQQLKDNLKDQKQENDQNREQIRRLRLSLQQAKFKQSGLQSQNSRLSNQISNLQGQFSRKQNQLLRQKRTTQKQNRELQFQLEKTREDSSWKQRKYQDTITHLQKENKSLSSQLNNYQKQVLIIKNSNSNQLLQFKKINLKLQYQSQQKTKSLTNLHDQIKKLENQLKFSGNQIVRLQCQIKQILSSQSRLKQQIGNLKTRIKEAEREKESECVKSIKIIDQQKLLLSNFSKQLEQLTVRAHNKNEQLISVKKINTVNKIETQSQNIDTHFQCKQRMRENQDMINLLKWTNQQYKKTNYQLQKDNQHKQHKILSLLDVKDTISNRLHIAQQQLQKRQTSIKLYERKIQQCNLDTYKYEHIKGQKQKLQAQVKQKDKQISQLQKKNRNLLKQKNTHLEEIQKLTYQLGCATKNKDKISILRSEQKSRALLLSMQKSLEMKNKLRKERDTSDINMGQLKQFESIQVQQQSRNKLQRVLEMLRNKRNQDRSSECSLNSSGSQEPKQMDWIVEEKDDEEEAKELLILSQSIEKLIDYKIKLEKQLKRALKQRQAVRISLIREIEEGVDNIIMYIYQNGIINSSYQIHKFRFEETTNSFGSISPMSVPETFPCYLQKYFCKLFNLIFTRNRISSNSSPQCYKSKQKS